MQPGKEVLDIRRGYTVKNVVELLDVPSRKMRKNTEGCTSVDQEWAARDVVFET